MSTTIQQVPTGTYALDPVHSTIGFGVSIIVFAMMRLMPGCGSRGRQPS